ncbi:MAG: hypothetical protein ACE361_09050 [Aureliella sp.]
MKCGLNRSVPDKVSALFEWDRRRLKCEYARCNLPIWSSVSGEYRGALLAQDGPFAQWATTVAFSLYGEWLGKGFVTGTVAPGKGYNIFPGSAGGGTHQKLRMDIDVARSEWDDQDCIQIDYRRHNLGPIRLLRGEFRELEPGILLGLGFFGPTLFGYRRLRRIIPFVMWGPFDRSGSSSFDGLRRVA